MKHILNDLTEQEKNAIREQHTGGMKIINEKFSKLLNSKLGDAKPLVAEQIQDRIQTSPSPMTKPKVMKDKITSPSPMTSPQANTGKSNPKTDYIGISKRKSDPQEYYKQFPCLGTKTVRFQNGMAITIKGGKVLLPEEGYDDKSFQQVRKGANQGLVGQVQGGGVYFCMSEYPDVLLMT
jgi:hypothetical protein